MPWSSASLPFLLALPAVALAQPAGAPGPVGPAALVGVAAPPGAAPDEGAAAAAPAPSAEQLGLAAFLVALRPQALREGVAPATYDRETAGLTYDPKVVRLDRAQPGGTPGVAPAGFADFAPYRRTHVDAAHIDGGRRLAGQLAGSLAGLQARFGVDPRVALAIFGAETGYGSYTGRYDLVRSFATLAYDGRRRALFAAELIATLKLIDRGFARAELTGSWAGATGFPQFLPSVYLRLGTDGDGDGRADIWTDRADALASIAAYLREAGWKPGVAWGVPVSVPADLDRAGLASPLAAPRCPRVHARLSRWLTMAEWRARGVQPQAAPVPADAELARLIEPDGPGATAYLTTANYLPILDYNCSNYYALSVGILADAIGR